MVEIESRGKERISGWPIRRIESVAVAPKGTEKGREEHCCHTEGPF
jgi:hypothetical protein